MCATSRLANYHQIKKPEKERETAQALAPSCPVLATTPSNEDHWDWQSPKVCKKSPLQKGLSMTRGKARSMVMGSKCHHTSKGPMGPDAPQKMVVPTQPAILQQRPEGSREPRMDQKHYRLTVNTA